MLYKIKDIDWEHDYSSTTEHAKGLSYVLMTSRDGTVSVRYCIEEYYNEGKETFDSRDEAKEWVKQHHIKQFIDYLEPVEDNNKIDTYDKLCAAWVNFGRNNNDLRFGQYLYNEYNFEVGDSYESNNFRHIYNLFITKYPDEEQQ